MAISFCRDWNVRAVSLPPLRLLREPWLFRQALSIRSHVVSSSSSFPLTRSPPHAAPRFRSAMSGGGMDVACGGTMISGGEFGGRAFRIAFVTGSPS